MPIDLDKSNFQQTVEDNDIVMVDFWAPWCGPCKNFAPTYEKLAASEDDVVFAKVNTEEQQELAGMFNIRSIPTLMVFREKAIVFSEAGALPEQTLQQIISGVKELDMKQVHEEVARQMAEQQAAQPATENA